MLLRLMRPPNALVALGGASPARLALAVCVLPESHFLSNGAAEPLRKSIHAALLRRVDIDQKEASEPRKLLSGEPGR